MKIAAIASAFALVTAALLSPASASAQTPFDDAMALLETDPVRALAAMEALAEAGDNEAVNAVAAIIDNPPEGVTQDQARALRLWEQAVAGGSDAARLNLGQRLAMNDDPDDDARAVSMLEAIRHAEMIPLAAYPLGRAYLFGTGVEQDQGRGSRLMETAVAAMPENMDAQFLLARAYQNGWGIPVDDAAAYRHMKIAADGDDPRAQWNVGMMLINGDGVTPNERLAFLYVQASAEGGYESGMISMAVMLATGEGTAVDAAQARQWYRRAAEGGSAHALRSLGAMLMTGEGGRVDAVNGAAYLDLAAKAGDTNARRAQQIFADQIAALDQGAVEAAKAAWLRDHGIPR